MHKISHENILYRIGNIGSNFIITKWRITFKIVDCCVIYFILYINYTSSYLKKKNASEGFPGGPVVKNPL